MNEDRATLRDTLLTIRDSVDADVYNDLIWHLKRARKEQVLILAQNFQYEKDLLRLAEVNAFFMKYMRK